MIHWIATGTAGNPGNWHAGLNPGQSSPTDNYHRYKTRGRTQYIWEVRPWMISTAPSSVTDAWYLARDDRRHSIITTKYKIIIIALVFTKGEPETWYGSIKDWMTSREAYQLREAQRDQWDEDIRQYAGINWAEKSIGQMSDNSGRKWRRPISSGGLYPRAI